MECPSCGHANPGDALFCMRCGTRLAVVCATCGRELPGDAVFCGYCGASVTAGQAGTPGTTLTESASSPIPTVASTQPASFAGGRYQVQRFLGEGGKKRVYLVHDTLLDRDVAFSLIKTQGLDETGIERIRREAQLMGRLGDHPYIVALYDIGEDAGQPFLVSQLMGGGDVEGLIEAAADHRPPLDVTLRIADQMCQALEYAHEHGIIHRDLKPGNVWLTADGTAKLGDFGLAMALDRTRLSVAGMIVGTVGYLPPEQALGRAPDGRSDLYSLGAMLYELVTGRPPFLGDDPVAIISQHLNTQPVAPHWHNPEVPKPLEALILRLLAKDPAERPQTARAVREQLLALEAVMRQPQPEATREPTSSDIRNPLDGLAGGVFVGREQELEQLRASVDAALGGVGRIVLLVGEPGIGKTTLAEELATYARLRGAQVLWSRNYEWEGTPAYWTWVQLIRDYAHSRDPQQLRSELGAGGGLIAEVVSEVREVVPDLPAAPLFEGEAARYRLFDAVATFLRNASRSQPLVLIIDDLHWADESSLLLLQYLARELRDARVVLVGTYRDIEVGRHHPLAGTLAELAREQRLERLSLRGLSRGDLARYLELTAGQPPTTEVVDAILGQTEGNPFFVAEVVRLLVSEGNLERAGGASWSVSLPQGVREVVGRRLDRLSAECNVLLSTAAVIGREFELRLLAGVVDQPADQVLETLEEALGARVIREGDAGDSYRFQQELIQETLYDELSIAQRRRLNGKVAEAMEHLYANDLAAHYAELAHHYSLAGSEHATKAIDYAVKAGERAMSQYAWESAVRHFELALQNLDLQVSPDPVQQCEILLALGEAQNRGATGRRGGAPGASPVGRDTFWRAAEVARSAGLAEHLARAALGVVGFSPHGQQAGIVGVQLVEEALGRLPSGDSALRVRLLARLGVDPHWLAFSGLIPNTPDLAVQLRSRSNEAIAMARRLGDSSALAYALAMRGLQYELHPHEDRLANADEIGSIAAAANDLQLTAWGHYLRQLVFAERGDMKAAHAALEQLETVASLLQIPYFLFVVANLRAAEALDAGQFADAEHWVERAYSVQPRSVAGTAQRIMVHRQRGNLEGLMDRFNEFPGEIRRNSFFLVRSLWVASLADTSPEDARRALQGSIVDDVLNAPLLLRGMSWLAETCYTVGDTTHAQILYEHLLPYAEYNAITIASDYSGGSVSYYLGLLAATLSRWDDAERHFEDALRMNEERGIRPYLAYSQFAFADMLVKRGESGDQERALQLVDQSLAAAEAMGMVKLSQEALALKVQVQGILKA